MVQEVGGGDGGRVNLGIREQVTVVFVLAIKYESPGGEGTTPPGLSRRYQASDTGLPVFADSVAASARRRASIASSMDGVGLVPATTASMNAVSSMR